MTTRQRTRALLCVIALALCAPGCGFLANLAGACDTADCRRRSPYYRGVYMDQKFWEELSNPDLLPAQRGVGYLITAIDFPVSALFDTLAVPFIAMGGTDTGPPEGSTAPVRDKR